jgi:hypothetical protein
MMKLLDVTSSLGFSVVNVLMTVYRQWILINSYYDVAWYEVPWSMHGHILLMQVAMLCLLFQILGRNAMSNRVHRRFGYAICNVFICNIPFGLRLAYLMLLRRHWWHSFVQITAMTVINLQLVRLVSSAKQGNFSNSCLLYSHQDHVKRLVSLVNGASGSRLMGLAYEFLLGFDNEISYTLGLTTMFILFLLPQALDMILELFTSYQTQAIRLNNYKTKHV